MKGARLKLHSHNSHHGFIRIKKRIKKFSVRQKKKSKAKKKSKITNSKSGIVNNSLAKINDLRKILFIFHKPYFRWLLNEVGNK